MNFADTLRDGSVYIKPNFLDVNQFETLEDRLTSYEYEPMYQPVGSHYGNRLQAYPCWETKDFSEIDKEYWDIFFEKIETILQEKLTYLNIRVRKIITEEIKNSSCNTKYGHVHQDHSNAEFAGVLYFNQAFDGGTALFEIPSDKRPDIEISAYRNRFVMYNGQRWHAPCTDFTFDERYVIIIFTNTISRDTQSDRQRDTGMTTAQAEALGSE